MHFDRIDICDAYYLFATLYHNGQSSKEYKIFGRLEKVKYKPGFALSEDSLTCNGRDIYQKLVNRTGNELPADYESCGECGFDHSYEYTHAAKEHEGKLAKVLPFRKPSAQRGKKKKH